MIFLGLAYYVKYRSEKEGGQGPILAIDRILTEQGLEEKAVSYQPSAVSMAFLRSWVLNGLERGKRLLASIAAAMGR